MFSLDDDSFDLSEEDFLQAAISVEKEVSSTPGQNTKTTLPERNNGTTGSAIERTMPSTNNFARFQPVKNQTETGTESLFSVGEGDDSVFDLSLDSPVKWTAGVSAHNERLETNRVHIAAVHQLQQTCVKERSFSKPPSPFDQCSSLSDNSPVQDAPESLSRSRPVVNDRFNQQVIGAHPVQRHENASHHLKAGSVSSPVSGTSSATDYRTSEKQQTCDSPFTDSDNSPSFFSNPKGMASKTKRKFPGPAGLLPKLKPGENLAELTSTDIVAPEVISKKSITVEDLPSSQSSEDHFHEGLWLRMLRELEPQAKKLLKQFPVESINHRANKKLLPNGKVPVLGAVIETISFKNSDASVCLKDPSGRIRGTVHRELVKEYGNILQAGSVLVLRQIGVFNPLSRNHYLNITPSNVVRIYSNSVEGDVSIVKLNSFVPEDFNVSDKPAGPSTDHHKITLKNSSLNESSLKLNASPSAGSMWNAIGRGNHQKTPRPGSFVRSPMVRPQTPRFLRSPALPVPTTPTPRSNFVRHTFSTPSMSSPSVSVSQTNPNIAIMSQSAFSTLQTPRNSAPQTLRSNHVQATPSTFSNRPACMATPNLRLQNLQNVNVNTPRFKTPNIPAGNVIRPPPAQPGQSLTLSSQVLGANQRLRTPMQLRESVTANSQVVENNQKLRTPPFANSNILQNSGVSNISKATTATGNHFSNSQPNKTFVANSGVITSNIGGEMPSVPAANDASSMYGSQKFRPPYNSQTTSNTFTGRNSQLGVNSSPLQENCTTNAASNSSRFPSQSVTNLDRTPLSNIVQSHATGLYINQTLMAPAMSSTPNTPNLQPPKQGTPGKFTFKRKANRTPSDDTPKKQQMSAPDLHEDLLAGFENELLDDDF